MAYFIGGYNWSGESQLDRFISEGIWENGYREDKYQEIFDEIKVGDFFALKATYTTRKNEKRSWLKIVNIGKVTQIINSYTLKVDWLHTPEQKLTDITWYANTLVRIEDKSHVSRIFQVAIDMVETDSILYILQAKHQIILQGAPGTGKTYTAKKVAERLTDRERIKLVQFHPSYTYEDFVRGIVVNTNNGVPEYTSVNKVLAQFAKDAWDNYVLSQKNKHEIKTTLQTKSNIERFIEFIQTELDEGKRYPLTTNVYLFDYDDKRFKYKGDNWDTHEKGLNMKYSELKKIINANVTERADIKMVDGIEALTKSHASYYTKMVEKFQEYNRVQKTNVSDIEVSQYKLHNYVLIIDEINRANLPAVLGELIYALEYRGEPVEGIYAIDGDSKIILPPNLYIIGTMNTADRSIGQIDYAIRRRFAFMNVLPHELDVTGFDTDLFREVSKLFIKNSDSYMSDVVLETSDYLSSEFRPEDVWLGHSYFIMPVDARGNIDPQGRNVRLHYEIIPILREYMRDGILNSSAQKIINALK